MLLTQKPPAEPPAPSNHPDTLKKAQDQADEAQEQAARLAAEAATAVDALAVYLAAEKLPGADTIVAAIGNANDNLKVQSAAAKSASEACKEATVLDQDALDAWEAALAARSAAEREFKAINDGIAQARRTPVVAQLDTAAKILLATITTITAAVTAAGFAAGDFTFFYRNHRFWALVYLTLAAIAVFVGTFAFLVDSIDKWWKLRAEQVAIYLGVAAFGVAFIVAVWGLAAGASGGRDRPVLSADLTDSQTAGTTMVTAKANRSAVPRSNTLVTSVWGIPIHGGRFASLRYDIVGASSDGTVSDSVDVQVKSGAYGSFVVTAAVQSPPQSTPAAPPSNCLPPGTTGGAPVDRNVACEILTP